MYLFILETIGTQELILVGLVALIVFGPRKLPQMARKFGSMLTEFRKVSNDFRQTWEREASFEENSFGAKEIDSGTVAAGSISGGTAPEARTIEVEKSESSLPEIKEMSAEEFETARAVNEDESAASLDPDPSPEVPDNSTSDKRNWL